MIVIKLLDNVGDFAGDKDVAAALRTDTLEPAMLAGTPVVLDFEGVELATQSFIHALISELVRATKFDALKLIEFRHCSESIRELIEIVAEYSQEDVVEDPDETVS
jgi:STAS-like domain of unknown function (DUF4325)